MITLRPAQKRLCSLAVWWRDMAQKFWAKRPFDYNGQSLDRGQVFEMVGARLDEKLVRLGYVAELAKKTQLHECANCGAQFVGLGERQGHYEERHIQHFLSPEEEDARWERKEKMLETVAPINFANAAAAA